MQEMLVVDPAEIKAWRMRLGLKQSDLAKLCGTTQDRISVIETRMAGTVRTYAAINRELRKAEAKFNKRQTTPQSQAIAA
jgi:predicted transcriptional regulator